MQRLRVKFARGEEVKHLSHLDLMRFWERAFRRAGINIVYSEGFTPHARISMAAPLQVGVTSQCELMDVWLSSWMVPYAFEASLKKQLPAGIEILETKLASLEEPSLQSRVKFAEYIVAVGSEQSEEELQSKIKACLESETIPWLHLRDHTERRYDLRPLIEDIWFISRENLKYLIGMRLRCDNNGTGRPEQVIRAMGFESAAFCMKSLVMSLLGPWSRRSPV